MSCFTDSYFWSLVNILSFSFYISNFIRRELIISFAVFMQMGLKSILAFLLVGYKCIGRASTEISLSKVHDFVQCLTSVLKTYVTGKQFS